MIGAPIGGVSIGGAPFYDAGPVIAAQTGGYWYLAPEQFAKVRKGFDVLDQIRDGTYAEQRNALASLRSLLRQEFGLEVPPEIEEAMRAEENRLKQDDDEALTVLLLI